ncbi:MAG: SCO family protein [Anaerolineae bacterium]
MKQKRQQRFILSIVGSLIAVIVVISVYIVYLLFSTPPTVYAPDDLQEQMDGITTIDPSLPMPDFTLTDHTGERLRLSDLDQRPTLITFGFTHCPDVCPITLGEMRAIREALDTSADAIDYVFISVDGARDTPETLTTYFITLRVADFMIGMTGNESSLRAIAEPFGVEFIYQEADQLGNYNVDHTAGMFLLDGNQQWIRRYRYGTNSAIIAEDITDYLQTAE